MGTPPLVSGNNTGSVPLTLSPNAAQLAPGAYYGLVEISDPHALNSPQYVTVVLDVESRSAPALADLSPPSLFFTAIQGQDFVATVAGDRKHQQLLPGPVSGGGMDAGQIYLVKRELPWWKRQQQTPGSFTVGVTPTGLQPRLYTGAVNVSMSGALSSVNVTYVVEPGTTRASGLKSRLVSSGCVAAKLAITETGPVNHFAIPAGWPATLDRPSSTTIAARL